MLEPRRLAARASAKRIAALMNTPLGGLVGYRTRFDSKVSPETRIEVLTEGILTRLIQDDPELSGVHTVIFDEFHERSIHADLALALCLDLKQALREDLHILVMSATLDAERVSVLLGGAPVVDSPGKVHPVQTVHIPRRDPRAPVESDLSRTIRLALEQNPEGDLLAFLPGEGEIRRSAALLKESLPPQIRIAPLYGNLPQEEQDAAIEPDPEHRKVILSTSIAETSLTIEGVRIVVDCGLMRVPKFSPRNGMGRLETVRVSLASANQRRGRAGRTAPGTCYRLWSAEEEARMAPFNTPEILETDLVPLVLELAKWGVRPNAIGSMAWLDVPPAAKVAQAAELLRELGALDKSGAITEEGSAMLALPVHPRLGHAVLRSKRAGFGGTACALAALLGERDPLRNADTVDLRLRLSALEGKYSCDPGFCTVCAMPSARPHPPPESGRKRLIRNPPALQLRSHIPTGLRDPAHRVRATMRSRTALEQNCAKPIRSVPMSSSPWRRWKAKETDRSFFPPRRLRSPTSRSFFPNSFPKIFVCIGIRTAKRLKRNDACGSVRWWRIRAPL